ncbi:hypothetical protein [Aurantiacibacter sediminis]|uniref:Uncharacterized protein n=1 Tax=Aurantiacibacter sediminis TaxID=2793064 RepID=A0ABS0N3I9_9SPHN|nr:hypothetical protein [Aurantiacibacter sediminis]MBH5322287.1 hypothetical protein [Aurantiacibacter sediminis]
MSDDIDPTKPIPNDEKFKPKNVASGKDKGRDPQSMQDVPRGSEPDRRRNASDRKSDQG